MTQRANPFLMRAAAIAAMIAIALALALAPARARADGPTWKSGVMAGFGPWADESFATWRGWPIQTATDFIGGPWSQLENPAWTIWAWSQDPSVRLVLTVPMWIDPGSLAEAASGAYNAHFVALAKNLIAAGRANTILRIGWEFNGTWYPWSVANATDAANFAAGWRQIVGAIQAVPGQRFGFDWSPTLADSGIDPGLAYPGDKYVTEIGLDAYDGNLSLAQQSPSDRWDQLVNASAGLAWQARFAAKHRKPLSFPEWGVLYYPAAPQVGGGDDPTFIQNMYGWFATHNVAFENYFDIDSNGQYYGLNTGNGFFPQAAAQYRHLWSGGKY